jgi:S-adenosylmethionine hydrolase
MIALITDFGLSDIYVGVMKSVIYGLAPNAVVVDITHGIAPYDVRAGSFALRGALPYIASGTVVVVIVDPGVGSTRLPIAVRSGKSWIIAPNNGVISGVAFDQAVVLDKPEAHRQGQISSTFHGRDIFAPAAAMLHESHDLLTVGTPIESKSLVSLERGHLSRTDASLIAEAQHIDRFGNIITNITPDILTIWAADQSDFTVTCGASMLPARRVTYYNETPVFDGLLLLVNSFGLIEIASNNASAARKLGGIQSGQAVTLKRI